MTIRALVTEPGVAGSTRVERMAAPSGGVPVRVLEVGVCGTDREIAHGLFGVPARDGGPLVLGHELLGEIAEDGDGFTKGELVTATVRRSCGHCAACEDNSPDSCLTGDYEERGITRLDGFARELVAEDPAQLIPVPRHLGRLGVLAEPTSICQRAFRHALHIGERQPWALERVLVLGAGSIGTLMALLLQRLGVEVWVASLEPENERFELYAPVDALPELGKFDLVFECAGDAQLMANAIASLRRNGVLCLLGIDGRNQQVTLDGRVLGVDVILENRVVFGSVNAQRDDWLAAVDALAHTDPEVLRGLIGLRVPLEEFEKAFAYRGGKATLVVSGTE